MSEGNVNDSVDTHLDGGNNSAASKNHSLKKEKDFKEKLCPVLNYNKRLKILDIVFDGYGIRLKDVDDFCGETVMIKYKGTLGKQNFQIKI